jgi:hypothetical protein
MDDDGLLRMGSRLSHSDLSWEEKHPVILPKCYVIFLLVRQHHILLNHGGVETLVTSLRDSMWIVGVRPMAKSVVKHCVACQQ